ncbi:hypothetical protein DL769_004403 [Monosporascus sp. CRB-8-3]|nr:hypothetical protein DL769_004403 [Monosporascus sp. CRB-8-3]
MLDTGEVCEFLDCGGGRAPPKTTVPGCPLYEGTMSSEPSYLPGFGGSATATAAATTSGAAAGTGSAASGEITVTATQTEAETGAETASADTVITTPRPLATTPIPISGSSSSFPSSPDLGDSHLHSESSLSSAGSPEIEEATMAIGAATSSNVSQAAAAAVTTVGANALNIGVAAAGFVPGVIVG